MTKFKSCFLLLILVYHCLVYKRRKLQKSERKQKEQTLLRFMTIAAFLLLFAFVFATAPAYAPGANPDTVIDPGGNGHPPWTIEGVVHDSNTGAPVQGINVYLYLTVVQSRITSSAGYFKFDGLPIDPHSQYLLTVNGLDSQLGVTWQDGIYYGQKAVLVRTDKDAYACLSIALQHFNIVEVPTAAMFSNTKYAMLSFEMTGTMTVQHSMSFSVSSPVGASSGYTTSTSMTSIATFTTPPLTQSKVVHRYYAATYWNDRTGGIAKAGLSGTDPGWSWDFLATNEYLTMDSAEVISDHVEHRLDTNLAEEFEFKETGSTMWSRSAGVPFAIQYMGFGVNINLDTTVTTTVTNATTLKYVIDRTGDENPNRLTFWAYTRGTNNLFFPDNGGNGTGGFELHVWDYSGAG